MNFTKIQKAIEQLEAERKTIEDNNSYQNVMQELNLEILK